MDLSLNNMMRRDYFKLRRNQNGDYQQAVERSIRLRQIREESLNRLELTVPGSLPISEHTEKIVSLIQNHPVLILAGETGSGKTTQIPKLCMRAGLGGGGMIGHTQPRRVAARTVSQRLAKETNSPLGEAIGYSVRFGDQTSDRTLVRIMTDGLLLSEIPKDRYLDRYDAIIIDEAHERSLNIDFLLGYLKGLLRKRADLKLIVTSATINVDRFAKFFDGAPVVEIPGRSYPISVEYLPEREDLGSGIALALDEILRSPFSQARDVLVFLSGEREIFETAKFLRQHYQGQLEILPLYSRLRVTEQEKVFASTGKIRRVILATNVAETSITVPNIGYVIDPGSARVNRYSYRSKLERLPVEAISRASADQRKGRCGRVAAGVCYRLYSEEDYLGRSEYSDPEIKRVNLASVLLQMKGLGVGEIESFPFIDPPELGAIRDAYRLLEELGAIQFGKLNKIGRLMSRIPLDPRLSRMLVEAGRFGGLAETLIIVSALSVSDPRERPTDKMSLADEKHEPFSDERSDFLGLLKLWAWLEKQRVTNSKNKWRKLLSKNFVSFSRVQEWREIYRQLKLICRSELNYQLNREAASYEVVHENILVGCLSLVARHDAKGEYVGARNLKLRLFPGSSLSKGSPKWVVASEITETSRVYARTVAKIDPVSIEKKSSHLVKVSDSEPTWSLKRGELIAYRTITLYGLRIVERRVISYSAIDPELSRKALISEGLVKGLLSRLPQFLEHNLLEIKKIRTIEEQHRRRGILVEDSVLEDFYESKLSASIRRFSDLQNWLRKADSEVINGLFMSQAQLFKVDNNFVQDDFPSRIEINKVTLDVKYAFAPGARDDGVSFNLPLAFLRVVGPEPFEWSVPGMLEPVIESWIRSLPKNLRKPLMPIQENARDFVNRLIDVGIYRKGRLLSELGSLIQDSYGVLVKSGDWDRTRLPEHLTPYFRILDEDGKVISEGRDLQKLKERHLGEYQSDGFANTPIEIQSGLLEFPEDTIVYSQTIKIDSAQLLGFPGLEDRKESVALILFESPEVRDRANRRGYPRLVLLKMGKQRRFFKNEIKKLKELSILFSSLGDRDAFEEQILFSAIWNCFFEQNELPSTADEFEALLENNRSKLVPIFYETVDLFSSVISLRFAISRSLDELTSVSYQPARSHIQSWVEELVPQDFLNCIPLNYCRLLPRYLDGISYRLNTLPGRVLKDKELMNALVPLEARLEVIKKSELFSSDNYDFLRFYVEEYKLAIFASNIAKRKVLNHPIDTSQFRPSLKRVDAAIKEEEKRIGVA